MDVRESVGLKNYTTFHIGGPAGYLIEAKSAEDVSEAIAWAEKRGISYTVLGGGSNVLVSDEGYDGLAIVYKGGGFKFDGTKITADGGVFTARIAMEARKNNFGGLDFAAGIPGTIAGAVIGNAGAYGRSISDVFESARVLENGKERKLIKKDMDFSYRSSKLKESRDLVILGVELGLEEGHPAGGEILTRDMQKRMRDYSGFNAGSYFKNLEVSKLSDAQKEQLDEFRIKDKISVGKMIDALGLKGKKSGGAIVGPNHANVITNQGNATAKDVLKLESEIIEAVKSNYGITIEPEIVKIGF